MFSSERLKGIDVFVCVADSGSFKGAAERLNLTASAISKAIARLESRLQVRLFHRTTRRLSLTDAGAAFHRTCTGVLADLEEAEWGLQAQSTELRGKVCIDLPGAFGRSQALAVILRFAQAHPLLQPQVTFSDHWVEPLAAGVDIAVRLGGPDFWPQALGQRQLGSEWHLFCASADYLRRHGTPLTAGDLQQHQCITYGWVDGRVSPWSFATGRPGEIERRVMPASCIIGDGEGLLMAVLAGYGIAQMPSWLVKRQLAEGTLVEVLPQLATRGQVINLLWLKSRQGLPKVAALLEVLADSLTPAQSSNA
ncbi:LysR family transcriptional regulator [Pseudomonas sp. Fl4BN1]|uniref:LysR family transcriptional regulator n=1 Tax=Pseudomonas sp. Fl4BN1 TaxID=2697651 RepID=UPI0013772090|nr:LysR family transcriptional regulator [Pseudomonas sp. Fl4BN1]NBF07845.1 LysR family transcriptional regulator [Pseudomonas sp. Fl4BN1]